MFSIKISIADPRFHTPLNHPSGASDGFQILLRSLLFIFSSPKSIFLVKMCGHSRSNEPRCLPLRRPQGCPWPQRWICAQPSRWRRPSPPVRERWWSGLAFLVWWPSPWPTCREGCCMCKGRIVGRLKNWMSAVSTTRRIIMGDGRKNGNILITPRMREEILLMSSWFVGRLDFTRTAELSITVEMAFNPWARIVSPDSEERRMKRIRTRNLVFV